MCRLGWGEIESCGSDATSTFLTALWVSQGWMLGSSSSGFVCILQSLGFLSQINAASDLGVVQKLPGQQIDALWAVEQSDSPSNSLRPLGSLLCLGGLGDGWTLLELGAFFQLPWCLLDAGSVHGSLVLSRGKLCFCHHPVSTCGFLSALCATPGAISRGLRALLGARDVPQHLHY